MKRVTCFGAILLGMLFAMLPAASVRAASPGQPIGKIYWSDIVAYIDGMPVESYSYDGRTLVVCETLRGYGFLSVWDPAARIVDVSTWGMPEKVPEWEVPKGWPGTVAGTVYATDIVTAFNGLEIASYNIGGRTAVAIEDLATSRVQEHPQQKGWPFSDFGFSSFGFSCAWDADNRTISLFSLRPGSQVECDLGKCDLGNFICNGEYGYSLYQYPLRLDGATLVSGMTWTLLPIGCDYLPWSEAAQVLGLKWQWDEGGSILSIGSADLSPVEPVSTEVPQSGQDRLGNSFGARIVIRVGGQVVEVPRGWSYVPADAVICQGKLWVRCEAIAAALGLIWVDRDGFYRTTDSPVSWDYTFEPYLANHESDWLLSATPSFFGGVMHAQYGVYMHESTAPIMITFSRKMNVSTMNPANIAVIYKTTSEDGRVHYQEISNLYGYTYDETTNTLTLTPSGSIDSPPGTRVTIAIKPSIADAEGNHPAAGIKTGFRTPE